MCGLLAPAGPVPDQVQFHSALLGTDGISAILATLSTLPLAGAAHGESAGGGGEQDGAMQDPCWAPGWAPRGWPGVRVERAIRKPWWAPGGFPEMEGPGQRSAARVHTARVEVGGTVLGTSRRQ